jgi:hypothetical protein
VRLWLIWFYSRTEVFAICLLKLRHEAGHNTAAECREIIKALPALQAYPVAIVESCIPSVSHNCWQHPPYRYLALYCDLSYVQGSSMATVRAGGIETPKYY